MITDVWKYRGKSNTSSMQPIDSSCRFQYILNEL
ncbi:StfH/YfcO family fimbrial adhesin [Escherichia coli]